MKIIVHGVFHHLAETFFNLQIFLAAVAAEYYRNDGATVETVLLGTIVLFMFFYT
ncbi:MAG: hypothetical protein JWP94_7 [Mucilaginibacter sp.]|jgi:hypothetical protein|nr:hypothetical protein [Mucilaginibacter sp.]